MKILWLVNIVMPELAVHLGRKPSVFGGWLTGAMEAVRKNGHELVVCATEVGIHNLERHEAGGVAYYLIGRSDMDAMRRDFREILQREAPDLVHIYGTEFAHSCALAREAQAEKLLVTVQGSLHYLKDAVYAGLPEKLCRDNLLHKALRALHKGGQSIELQRISFSQRAELECEVLRRAKYIHGGSAWGNAVARSINPDCTTFDCGLILRDSFYGSDRWNYGGCTPHSICALLTYPIKGFHKLLDAMPMILHRFPDAKIYVVGNKLQRRNYTGIKKTIMDHAPDYQWLLQQKIQELKLEDHLEFVGYLDEAQMKEQMLRSHVFVSPSALENQSTALGEAMILGVPSVASCVGAMQEMIDHGRDGFLYPFNEHYLLADNICRIFESKDLAEQFSREGHLHAARTYDREENCRRLLEMYETIAGA